MGGERCIAERERSASITEKAEAAEGDPTPAAAGFAVRLAVGEGRAGTH